VGKDVFANKMAIAAKAGDGKLIAAFPDVCNGPPAPPTGPMPVPYPNSSFSRDLKGGTKRVKIGGKPAGVDGSYLQTSPLGNEAATKSFGGSLLSHTISGKAYYQAYSFDVMFEGRGVARHLDLMTSNHASYPGSTPPLTEMEQMALAALADETKLCPCCRKDNCTAALSAEVAPGVPREAYSFREYYNLDEVDPGGALTAKATQRRAALSGNPCAGGACPNAGKELPKSDPPCDVYRVLTAAESDENGKKPPGKTKRALRIAKGVPPTKDALAQKVLRDPKVREKDLLAHAEWTDRRMNLEIQIDHTTPRAAGGCPSSPSNVAAHAKKCSNCMTVDGLLDTWSGQELIQRRAMLGLGG
jgi:hypothetical protein